MKRINNSVSDKKNLKTIVNDVSFFEIEEYINAECKIADDKRLRDYLGETGLTDNTYVSPNMREYLGS